MRQTGRIPLGFGVRDERRGMARRRVLALLLLIVLVAMGCGGDEPGSADADTITELQAEVNRLKAELDLATTGTTSATLATDTTLGGEEGSPQPGAADLVPFYDEVLVGLAARTDELGARVTQANGAWENQSATYETTHEVFTEVYIEATALSEAAQVLPIPPELEVRYAELIAAFDELADAGASLVAGLEAPDDGTLRRAAADRITRWVDSIQSLAVFD